MLAIAVWTGYRTILIVCVILTGAFIGLNNTLVTAASISVVPVPRPVASAAYSFVRFFGAGVAPFVASMLAARYSVHTPFYLGALTALAPVPVIASARRLIEHAVDAVEGDGLTAGWQGSLEMFVKREAWPGVSLKRRKGAMVVTAGEVMTREVRTVRADAPLKDCMAAMVQGHFSGLPVVEGQRVVGIVTEGDLIKRLRHHIPWAAFFIDGTTMAMIPPSGESLHELLVKLREWPIRDLMTPNVVTVSPDQEIEEVAKVLIDRHIKRVPVLDGHRLVGIISRGDLVRGMLQG